MDTVRFGRTLGFGARSAAKTLIQAVDAAKSDNPSRKATNADPDSAERTSSRGTAEQSRTAHTDRGVPVAFPNASAITQQGGGLRAGAKQFHQLAVKPAVRLTGALVLEIAGVFFAVFALYGVNTMWRARGGWHSPELHSRQFAGGVVMLVVFGYFSVTSFLRARRRERGR